MTTPATLTPAQVRELLAGTTEGRWYAYAKWSGGVDLHVTTPADEEADTTTVLFIACSNTAADAALAAAAPDIARAYLDLHAQAQAQAARLAAVEMAAREIVDEYDGPEELPGYIPMVYANWPAVRKLEAALAPAEAPK